MKQAERVGLGEVGGCYPPHTAQSGCFYLAVERPWLALGGPHSLPFAQRGF